MERTRGKLIGIVEIAISVEIQSDFMGDVFSAVFVDILHRIIDDKIGLKGCVGVFPDNDCEPLGFMCHAKARQ